MSNPTNRASLDKLGITRNGISVLVDRKNSHAATHFLDTRELESLVKEALSLIDITAEKERLEVDLGRAVGRLDLVEITSSDLIYYAKRIGRETYSPFVMNREPGTTSLVSLTLHRNQTGAYELYTAWLGGLVPGLPCGRHETPESLEFWRSHALIDGCQAIEEDTRTFECPW